MEKDYKVIWLYPGEFAYGGKVQASMVENYIVNHGDYKVIYSGVYDNGGNMSQSIILERLLN